MSIQIKRIIFFTLIVLFIIYSIIIYRSNPENPEARKYLTDEAKMGKILFQEYNCISCHQIYGLGGYMGPDLTNIISTPGKGDLYAKSFIQFGTLKMPNFNLSESEINCLVSYLKYIDKTGISPVRNFSIEYDGTVTQKLFN